MIFIALLAFIAFAAFFVVKIVKATKAQTNGDILKSNTTKNEDETELFFQMRLFADEMVLAFLKKSRLLKI